jgi:N-acetylglucosaminyldiphosphoundecaprenol N-acetyl-beta-D-mannosaminyltransferase
MRVDAVESAEAAALIAAWAAASAAAAGGRAGEAAPARYVCAANVHMTMEAHDDPAFQAVVNAADLVVPDGQPMVWALRALGLAQERRVRVTPDLLIELFAACEARGLRVGLYGGTPETLERFVAFLREGFPDLDVPFAWSPPFRPLTADEDADVVRRIREAGVQLLLVGIGCPKQERWMAAHAGGAAVGAGAAPLPCVMFGVGAAFDMLSGRTKNAPAWMRDRGLEWLFRLATEPRRLWRRHLRSNPRFLVLFALQALRSRR